MQPDSTFLAWLAGFIDGEGCLTVNKSRNAAGSTVYSVAVVISNTVREPLDEIVQRLGMGSVHARPHRGIGRRDMYQFRVSGPPAQGLIRAVRESLRVKQRQADILLRFESLPRAIFGDRDQQAATFARLREPQARIYEEIRTLNRPRLL